jgi:glycosyltransferase involved in cell wall biosynthesis
MAASRPVVATDVGGAREAIVEGQTGYLVESGDAKQLAARVVELLRDSEKAAQFMYEVVLCRAEVFDCCSIVQG